MLRFLGWVFTTVLNVTNRYLASWPIGCYMESSASKHVRITLLLTLRRSVDPPPDVYSYNFPDDKRSLKFIGERPTVVYIPSQFIGDSH